MKTTTKTIAKLLMCSIGSHLLAQESASALVTRYVSGDGNDMEAYYQIDSFPRPLEVAAVIRTKVQDSTIKDQTTTFVLIRALAKRQTDKQVRYSYIKSLEMLLDKHTKSMGMQVLKAMSLFRKEEFDPILRDKIHELVYSNPRLRAEAALLCGFFGGTEERSVLTNKALMKQLSKKDIYYLRLALVRLNHPESILEMISELSRRKINDQMMVSILEDLVYTKNRWVYDYLLEEVNSDEKNCLSANSESNEKIGCGFRIMEALSESIVDFPVKTDGSGELIGDYRVAMETSRRWFSANKATYTIATETY